MPDENNSMPLCPGCHFRCRLDDFQCARGEKLYQRWLETGEVPARRKPGPPPAQEGEGHGDGRGHGGGPKGRPPMPINDRLMHMLHIVGIALDDLQTESGGNAADHKVLDCIMRHDRAASVFVIAGRTQLEEEEISQAAQSLESQGFVAMRTVHDDTVFFELTEAGLQQAKAWEADRKAAEAKFLDVLTDDEKSQFHDLVVKVLEPGFKRMAQEHEKQEAKQG